MRGIWWCLICFGDDDRVEERQRFMDADNSSPNPNSNPKPEKFEVQVVEKEEEREALELAGGGSKRDLEGVVVEREKSLYEALELSVGGSSSSGDGGGSNRHFFECLNNFNRGVFPAGLPEDEDFNFDSHFKRAKFDSGSRKLFGFCEEIELKRNLR